MKKPAVKVIYPEKAKIKETVMFVFACVVLISTVCCLFLPAGIDMENGTNSNLEQTVPGEEVIAIMGGLYIFAVIGVILCIVLMICWSVGMVVSIKLVMRKNVIPRWMHISSIILTSCYFTLILTLIISLIAG